MSSNRPDPHRAWWKEPMVWLVGGLPAAAVVAGITTVMIAFDKPDTLVGEGHVKQGMAITETTTPGDLRASELGVSAKVAQSGGRIDLTLKGFLEPMPESVRLTIFHPTLADRDVVLSLTHTRGASYEGGLSSLEPGKRKFVLEPEDHAWRIAGEGILSSTTSVLLAASQSSSSTHP